MFRTKQKVFEKGDAKPFLFGAIRGLQFQNVLQSQPQLHTRHTRTGFNRAQVVSTAANPRGQLRLRQPRQQSRFFYFLFNSQVTSPG
jgi:hypothetical protein